MQRQRNRIAHHTSARSKLTRFRAPVEVLANRSLGLAASLPVQNPSAATAPATLLPAKATHAPVTLRNTTAEPIATPDLAPTAKLASNAFSRHNDSLPGSPHLRSPFLQHHRYTRLGASPAPAGSPATATEKQRDRARQRGGPTTTTTTTTTFDIERFFAAQTHARRSRTGPAAGTTTTTTMAHHSQPPGSGDGVPFSAATPSSATEPSLGNAVGNGAGAGTGTTYAAAAMGGHNAEHGQQHNDACGSHKKFDNGGRAMEVKSSSSSSSSSSSDSSDSSSRGGNGNSHDDDGRRSPHLPRPATAATDAPKAALHPAFYVIFWISMSSSVILFNKYLLDSKRRLLPFPIFLTSWHLGFASLMTQLLARTTTLLDGRKRVKMTGRVYLRAIVPIGIFFSLSLICGNKTYMYLSVSFIQMLKATTPVAVLLTTWALGLAPPNLRILLNVSVIVGGVIIASIGEIHFVLLGFLYQIGGICFEATRLVMVQRLLSSPEYKMDPLVSLYYFAPICAVLNGLVALVVEVSDMSFAHFKHVGAGVLLLNAVVAFLLNVAVVFLIGKTSSLVLTLCGVLKDVLLVCLSCALFRSPVTPLQIFGYTIALGGLITYQLGLATIREYVGQAAARWSEYGAVNTNTKHKKLLAFVAL
ncbi:hypothetical protein KEM52_006692, partial [Ascosphaera acerosa]